MDRLSFEELLDRYLTGELSSEDRKSLAAMIDRPEHAAELESFVRERMLSDELVSMSRQEGEVVEGLGGSSGGWPGIKDAILAHWEKNRDGISGNSPDRILEKSPDRIPGSNREELLEKKRIVMRRYAVAAAVLLILGAGVVTWNIVKEKTAIPVVSVATETDVAPGHEGAILKLADGRTIVLDSSRDGSLAEQGNMAIIKQSAGQLVYNQKGPSTAGGQGTGGVDGVSGAAGVPEVMYNTLTTPRGRRTSVVLSDGTRVWLNSGSSIRFPTTFVGKERNVEVTGQAYFEVAKNASQPFKVKVLSHTAPEQVTREIEIEVLGTAFDLMAYNDEDGIRTTLVDGSVKVVSNADHKLLKPREQAVAAQDGRFNLNVVDVQKVTAWKDGNFLFRDDDLGSIMKELARWYDIDVHFEGVIKDHYTGTIGRQVNISQVLKMLEAAGGVSFTVKDRQVLVLPHTM